MGQELRHGCPMRYWPGANVSPHSGGEVQTAIEACRRAKFKFPGRQKIHVSSKYGLTKFNKEDYKKWKDHGRLIPNGIDVRWLSSRGPLHRLIGRQRGKVSLPTFDA